MIVPHCRQLAFDPLNDFKKPLVEFGPVMSKVGASMAGFTKANHKTRIVGASVADTTDVMDFQVRRSVLAFERSFAFASFAMASGARQNVVTNVLASLVNRTLPVLAWSNSGGIVCFLTEIGKTFGVFGWLSFELVCDLCKRLKPKNERLPELALSILRACLLPTFAHILASKYEWGARSGFLKYEKIFAVDTVISKSLIALIPFHWALLALSVIEQGSIRKFSVLISVLFSFFCGNGEDNWVGSWSYNSALPLPFILRVDIFLSNVVPSDLEIPLLPHAVSYLSGDLGSLSYHRKVQDS